MLYVAFLSFRASISTEQQQAALGRRAIYQFPDGMRQLAEYWPAGPTQVVVIFEADSFDPIFKLILDWQDVFEINVYPATTAEAGLQTGARLIGMG